MTNPTTVNLGIIVPLTGADVDTWGEDDVNPNMVAIDGLIGGVQTVSLTNVPVTLTAPAGFTATPSAGPTQSQNRVLKLTGTLTGDVLITLPLPCVYIIDNQTVAGASAYVVQLRGAVANTEVIALPPGSVVTVYNDGSNVRFVDLGKTGDQEFWAGRTSMPRWVTSCTKAPYLIADGSTATYNFSDYPTLGSIMLAYFGGNGVTTFGLPDLAGRVPLAYDRTGTRITTAGCGINGQTLGAVNSNAQSVTLAANQIPTHSSTIAAGAISVTSSVAVPQNGLGTIRNDIDLTSSGAVYGIGSTTGAIKVDTLTSSNGSTASATYTNASQQVINNVQPAQVAGIWVIKT